MESKILRNALGPEGFHIRAVHPGWLQTDMGRGIVDYPFLQLDKGGAKEPTDDPAVSAAGVFGIVTGEHGEDAPLFVDFNGKANPTVTFDGTYFFVSWQTGSFPTDPPAGIFATRVSIDGEVVDPGVRGDGMSLSGPPPTGSRYVYPVVKAGIDNILTTWINNNETNGASKDIRGVLIPSL